MTEKVDMDRLRSTVKMARDCVAEEMGMRVPESAVLAQEGPAILELVEAALEWDEGAYNSTAAQRLSEATEPFREASDE